MHELSYKFHIPISMPVAYIWGLWGFLGSGIQGVDGPGFEIQGAGGSRSRVWESRVWMVQGLGSRVQGDPGLGYGGLWSRCGGMGSRSFEKCSSCQDFSNKPTWRGLYGAKSAFFKKTQGCGYTKHSSRKMTPFCHGMFQIQLLEEEMWGKNCIFQNNIGVWVLKTFISKNDPFSWNLLKDSPISLLTIFYENTPFYKFP